MKSLPSHVIFNTTRVVGTRSLNNKATLSCLAAPIRIHNFSQIRNFAYQAPRTDANVAMPGYVRPATADMRSQEPIEPMTDEQRLDWSKQNREFRYVARWHYIYPCTKH